MEARGEIPKGTTAKWEKHTPKKKLPMRVGKMSDAAMHERSVARMIGKAQGTLYAGRGASPAPYDPIPDYADIYYQPEDDTRREDESEATANRRRAMGVANRGKYGFHGTGEVSNAPVLRYEDGDFTTVERRDDGMRHVKPNEPFGYTQPVSTQGETNEDADDAFANRTDEPDRKLTQPRLIIKQSKLMGKQRRGPSPAGASEGSAPGVRFGAKNNEALFTHTPKQTDVAKPPKLVVPSAASRRPRASMRMGR